jgi:hypothetical protein
MNPGAINPVENLSCANRRVLMLRVREVSGPRPLDTRPGVAKKKFSARRLTECRTLTDTLSNSRRR